MQHENAVPGPEFDESGPPSLKSSVPTVRTIAAGDQTGLVLSHVTTPWHDRIEPGFTFQVWAPARSNSASWRQWARVEVTAACRHERLRDLGDCEAGHRPETIERGRKGWRRIADHAVVAGEPRPLPPGRWAEKANGGWTIVEFVRADSGKVLIKRSRSYRNRIEREIAEDARYYEWLRLSAAKAGEVREVSDDERLFRAKVSAYNRKLTRALGTGADPALITLTDAEIDAELPPTIWARTGVAREAAPPLGYRRASKRADSHALPPGLTADASRTG